MLTSVLAVRKESGLPEPRRGYWMWCPGCDDLHRVVDGANGWTWDGNLTAPTFSPSILVTGGSSGVRCHSFVRAGVWEFLSDCTHSLAGQHVPLPDLPGWFLAEDAEAQR